MLKISASAQVKMTYNKKFVRGQIVEIDAIKLCPSQSGVSLRVVGVWNRPMWFDGSYFVGLEE